jgi:hypothetical protein
MIAFPRRFVGDVSIALVITGCEYRDVGEINVVTLIAVISLAIPARFYARRRTGEGGAEFSECGMYLYRLGRSISLDPVAV